MSTPQREVSRREIIFRVLEEREPLLGLQRRNKGSERDNKDERDSFLCSERDANSSFFSKRERCRQPDNFFSLATLHIVTEVEKNRLYLSIITCGQV